MTAQKKPSARAKSTAAKSTAAKSTAAKRAALRRRRVIRRRITLLIAAALIFVFAFAVFRAFRPSPPNMGTLVNVSDDVLQYEDAVTRHCEEYGIREYSTVMMAIMQQESAGQGTDVFQCSESPFNTEYENTPESIPDPDYSIRVGAETFAYCLELADCKSISDTEALKMAIQEYNFGNNYADWAIENYGGYSPENAWEYSEMMRAQLGWSSYGDPEYVSHVLRYIDFEQPA